jgi:hypothetical protein
MIGIDSIVGCGDNIFLPEGSLLFFRRGVFVHSIALELMSEHSILSQGWMQVEDLGLMQPSPAKLYLAITYKQVKLKYC